jgi:hypothetical protein
MDSELPQVKQCKRCKCAQFVVAYKGHQEYLIGQRKMLQHQPSPSQNVWQGALGMASAGFLFIGNKKEDQSFIFLPMVQASLLNK